MVSPNVRMEKKKDADFVVLASDPDQSPQFGPTHSTIHSPHTWKWITMYNISLKHLHPLYNYYNYNVYVHIPMPIPISVPTTHFSIPVPSSESIYNLCVIISLIKLQLIQQCATPTVIFVWGKPGYMLSRFAHSLAPHLTRRAHDHTETHAHTDP